MITSNQIISITENYVDLVSVDGTSYKVEVYVNPTNRELYQLNKQIPSHILRFSADVANKKVYVWDGMKLLHGESSYKIGIYDKYQVKSYFNYKLFMGLASISGGKAKVTRGADTLQFLLDSHKANKDINKPEFKEAKDYFTWLVSGAFNWMVPYVDPTEFFNKIKKEVLLI